MTRNNTTIAIFILATIVSLFLSLFGAAALSFALIGTLITYFAAINSANDFVEVAFDKDANGQVSRSYFGRMTLLISLTVVLLTTSANPVIIGIASLIIYVL